MLSFIGIQHPVNLSLLQSKTDQNLKRLIAVPPIGQEPPDYKTALINEPPRFASGSYFAFVIPMIFNHFTVRSGYDGAGKTLAFDMPIRVGFT
jgi:hypothetical protein